MRKCNILLLTFLVFLSVKVSAQVTYYVKGSVASSGNGLSWATAFKTLEEALTVTNQTTNANIYIAQGEYYATRQLDATEPKSRYFQVKSDTKIYGGFPAFGSPVMANRNSRLYPTILSADVNNTPADESDNAYAVLTTSPGISFTADGLTITDTRALKFNGGYQGGCGINGIENNFFFNDLVISNNEEGAISTLRGKLVITNSSITNNRGSLTNTISINEGDIYVMNCVFSGNKVSNAGILNIPGNPGANGLPQAQIVNCTFYNNQARYACIFTYNQNTRVRNCLFNSTTTPGGTPLPELEDLYSSNNTFTYCITENRLPKGVGNVLLKDPLFKVPGAGELSLLATSLAINAGDNNALLPVNLPDITDLSHDIEGNPRINGQAVDIGAYEYQRVNVNATGIVRIDPSPTNRSALRYQLTLSAPVFHLDSSNFSAVNADVTAVVAANQLNYIITIKPKASGPVSITLANDAGVGKHVVEIPLTSPEYVVDIDPPALSVSSLLLYPDVTGKATITKSKLQYSVSDNLSPVNKVTVDFPDSTVNWADGPVFTEFTATAKDESGNTTIDTFTVTLQSLAVDTILTPLPDISRVFGSAAPQAPVLPEQVSIRTKDGQTTLLNVSWDVSSYNGDEAGTYTFPGTLQLPAWITAASTIPLAATCKVEKRTAQLITPAAPVIVPFGTLFSAVPLPPVTVSYSDGSIVQVPVTWTSGNYDGTIANAYTISGQLQPDINSTISNANVQIGVTVSKGKQQLTVTPVSNKLIGDPDFTLQGSSSAGLPVLWYSDNPAVITISGNTAHVGQPGKANITASQVGSTNYEPATGVTISVTVVDIPAPVITAQGNTTFCDGATVALRSAVAGAYQWFRNGQLLSGETEQRIVVSSSGDYTVQATHPNGYKNNSLRQTVLVNPLPAGSIGVNGSTTISKGYTVQLLGNGGSSYSWTPATGLSDPYIAAPVARPEVTTTYTVTITNNSGCSRDKSITVTVIEDDKITPSNIITPNGDGYNDKWMVANLDMYPDNEVKIFDRAGRLIYQRQNYTNNWDATVNGHPLAEGTYYYMITFGPRKVLKKGYITIIR